jgi:ABC-type nickel/cobalt efflux system permease component RcnA
VVDTSGFGYALQDVIFVLFRVASAGVITGAAAYILWHQWFTERLSPTYVWNYVGICLTLVAVFRWFIVVVTMDQFSDFYEDIEPWLQPMTQAGYILLGMCFLVMTYTHIKAKERHMRHHHPVATDD